ncbi:protein kinase subdomain-containing protein PKL/ccin3 [Coprinopsis cinerea okayama7|uniref:Protein kinase subdomain-containing protein PKL/ccin3 n=1 Tax=Coprinopsis cinerea (strain Okayama-7 / 130 / ATCC MYA-4618 / FGSC 9003) TaxID=240176 RepID=A8N8C2_COPC7|nr:protein kinase subdomain-containing protein PKL/ccin3 [Coprinopsis cinerea okayama7\|eukprot:XP_001831078.2 protein kinase subdomain-containing protein PKL/ccin3 [Coprinopsis cinerea okayama7\
MFSTLLINNCATVGGKSTTISLEVSPSHPSAIWYRKHRGEPAPVNWNSKKVAEGEGELELTLLERISEGRIGVTYVAKVDSAMRGDVDLRAMLPEKVCLKFAKPEFCRSLAREAWFYEQLESCQGASIPIFYGFFSSSMAEQPWSPNLTFTPWTTRKHQFDTDSLPREIDQYPSLDLLPDDMLPDWRRKSPIEDPSGYQQNSSWYRWSPSEDNPTISVLVLELLGETCTGKKGLGVNTSTPGSAGSLGSSTSTPGYSPSPKVSVYRAKGVGAGSVGRALDASYLGKLSKTERDEDEE